MEHQPTSGGPLSGIWYDVVFAQDEGSHVIDKCDRMECLHDPLRDVIWGRITRVYPANQQGKTWEFMGYVNGPIIEIAFRSTDFVNNPGSYGIIIYLRVDEGHYQGYYYRPISQMSITGEFVTTISGFRIDWLRKPPPELHIHQSDRTEASS